MPPMSSAEWICPFLEERSLPENISGTETVCILEFKHEIRQATRNRLKPD